MPIAAAASTLPTPAPADDDARIRKWARRYERLAREQQAHLDRAAVTELSPPIVPRDS